MDLKTHEKVFHNTRTVLEPLHEQVLFGFTLELSSFSLTAQKLLRVNNQGVIT